MTLSINVTLPSIAVSSIKGPWLAKLEAIPGAERTWKPSSIKKNFLRWTRRTEKHSIYTITEPGIYQGLRGEVGFNPLAINPHLPLKAQAARYGLFEVYETKDIVTKVPCLKTRRLETKNAKTGRISPDWNQALKLLFPETTGLSEDYMVPGTDKSFDQAPLFDFAKDTRTAAENAEALEIPRYNRVDCRECGGRGHHIEHRSVVAETDTVVTVPLMKKDGTPSKTKKLKKVVHESEILGTFPAPGRLCGACGGSGYYLVSIDTVDPLSYQMTQHFGSAVTQTPCESLLEAREQAAAKRNEEPTPVEKTVYWVDYGAGAPRRRIVEHWATSDPVSDENTVQIESWNEKIDDVVAVLSMSADAAVEANA